MERRHIERGGLTSKAQSVATKRARRKSIHEASSHRITPQEQSHKDKVANLVQEAERICDKMENEPTSITREDASTLQSREARAHGQVEKSGIAAQVQSMADHNEGSAVSTAS